MSWQIIDQSKTGNIEFIIAQYPSVINDPGTIPFLNIEGFTKGTVEYSLLALGGGTLDVQLEGSHDSSQFFPISPKKVLDTSLIGSTQFLTWTIPCKVIRINLTNGGSGFTIGKFILNAVAGGVGAQHTGSGNGTRYCPGNDKEIEFNKNGVCGADPSLTYDYTSDPKTLIVGFKDIGGLKRLSATSANSWEDGHLGNSSNLIFTPADFTNLDTAFRPGVDSQTPDPRSRSSRWYGIMCPKFVAPVIAQKIIPKGFRISDGNRITIHTPAGDQSLARCTVSGQTINIANNAPLTYLFHNASPPFFSTNTPTLFNGGGKLIGDGETMITVLFSPAAGVFWTTANSPVGVTISMNRI